MWKLGIISAILLVVLVIAQSSQAEVIELEPKLEAVVNSLCADQPVRLGRPSSIGLLADYFKSLEADHERYECREKFLKHFQLLRIVVDVSRNNICSRIKMELISKFHWHYIIGSLSWWWRKASPQQLPEPLRLFFLHYANEVAEQCKQTLVDRLETSVLSVENNGHAEILQQASQVGGIVNQLRIALVPQDQFKNYDSFFFLWSQLMAKERKKGNLLNVPQDELTKEMVVSLIKMRDPSKVWDIQHQCRHQLRPIYQQTVLPVMRLLEMGYGKVEDADSELVRDNKMLADWYSIAQLCELLVPINFYKDEGLKQDEATILAHPDETKGLGRASDIVPDAADDQIAKQVKSRLESRSRTFGKFFKNIFGFMKDKMWGKMKNIFVSRKDENTNKFVEENANDVMKESEDQINELLELDQGNSGEDSGFVDPSSRLLVRRKREDGSDIGTDEAIAMLFRGIGGVGGQDMDEDFAELNRLLAELDNLDNLALVIDGTEPWYYRHFGNIIWAWGGAFLLIPIIFALTILIG